MCSRAEPAIVRLSPPPPPHCVCCSLPHHPAPLQERPDAILPTMGGQTGLNLAKNLAESGEHHTAWHSTPQHGTARHNVTQRATVCDSMPQRSGCLYWAAHDDSTGQHRQYSYRAVGCSAVLAASKPAGAKSSRAQPVLWAVCRAGHNTPQQVCLGFGYLQTSSRPCQSDSRCPLAVAAAAPPACAPPPPPPPPRHA